MPRKKASQRTRSPGLARCPVELLGGFGGGDQRLDPCVQTGLVAAGSVLVQHALLDALVEDGDGLAIGRGYGLLVAGGDCLA